MSGAGWRRAAIAILPAVAFAACSSPRVGARPGGVVVGSRTNTGWARKEVVEKRAPETLMAADASICRVSPDRFAGTKVGDVISCNWQ